ncbi:MAG: hypothetical protein EPN62_19220 [Candidimonas sp.]|nr:MAG: hypothetical protein EPN77_18530 [Candidimonas sp.]TAM18779.1 MAG: hypothetical protein EPN62_19220 [Candidimonas sp.]
MNTLFTSISVADFADLDCSQTVVLTVNNRYARRIVSELSARLSDAQQVMALPEILPLGAWLQQASDLLAFSPQAALAAHTLDSFGAQQLWQQVIEHAESDRILLDIAQAARLASDADRLLSEWKITINAEEETRDFRRFQVWRDDYRNRLAQIDAEDGNLAYERVCQAIAAGQLKAPFQTLVLAGFNDWSPRFLDLLQALHGQGVAINELQMQTHPADCVRRILASDPDSEWRLAAQWAAQCLSRDPRGRYAIVAARLETDVAFAHRVVREALNDAATDIPLLYNVAVGRPLLDWPLAHAALAWLELFSVFAQGESCTPEIAGLALLAGHCEGQEIEASGRAMIDARWRKKACIEVSEDAFGQVLAKFAPNLGRAWQQMIDGALTDTGPAAMDVWVRRFKRMLQDLGFPGESVLDSHAYQVMEALERVLSCLSRQAVVLGEVDFHAAVNLFRQLALETPFQPQRDPAARLDVLGFLEAEGGVWDGVWVLGLSDEILPAAPKPNPFIAPAALRRSNAPRATAERELQWAHDMYAALCCCAPQVWVSHAQFEGERLLRPSPFIADLIPQECAPQAALCRPAALESLLDEQGPALDAGSVTQGGIGVIDTQARNPMWAFVKYRLGASRLDGYAEMADQNARGIFLHRAVEIVWRLIGDQSRLLALQADAHLQGLVEQSVQQAAQEYLSHYGAVLKRLEIERAYSVVNSWLQVEMAREPFRVREVEHEYHWSHGALQLKLRVDRIDELSDARLAIIDYKSGSGRIDPKASWMRRRPVDVQLPLYAAVLAGSDATVAALMLARLHAKQVEVKGLADGDYGFKGLDSPGDWPDFSAYSWAQVLEQWRDAIELLAQEYAAGVASNRIVQPADMDYCDVLPFLRLDEEARHDH